MPFSFSDEVTRDLEICIVDHLSRCYSDYREINVTSYAGLF